MTSIRGRVTVKRPAGTGATTVELINAGGDTGPLRYAAVSPLVPFEVTGRNDRIGILGHTIGDVDDGHGNKQFVQCDLRRVTAAGDEVTRSVQVSAGMFPERPFLTVEAVLLYGYQRPPDGRISGVDGEALTEHMGQVL